MGLDPEKDVLYFARTDFRNANKLIGIKRNDRRQHVYVIGKTGTGKSALLNNLIVQDIMNGEGVCVVDPHGELVEGLLTKIPRERINDVIYFNPADTDYHIGFNVLELPDPKYKHLVASGLMGIFTKIWSNVWSARMEYILNNAILALLDTPEQTLLGINRILTDKDYRQKIIANVKDPVVKAFWVHEYEQWRDQFRNEAIAPIQNKVGQFLSTDIIRNVVGQKKSTINIFDIMNSGKILLINVSKGRVGEDNSALLGAMLITKIQLAAMERVRIPEDERVDFYLYVDEFQNFATDSFAGVLSEARKYRLNLILAHQYIGQLVTDVSTKVRDAIFGNVGTMIIFRVGAADAEFLEKEMEPEFLPQDIVNLPNYCIYLKLMTEGVTARPFSAATLPPFKVKSSTLSEEEIVKESRRRYARPRTTVEEEVQKWTGMMGGGEEGAAGERRPWFREQSGPPGRGEEGAGRPFGRWPERRQLERRPQQRERYAPELADLGIEFEQGKQQFPERPPREYQKDYRPSAPPVWQSRQGTVDRRETAPFRPAARPFLQGEKRRAMPLEGLKPTEKAEQPKQHAKPEIDIAELRQAINASINRGSQAPAPVSTKDGGFKQEDKPEKHRIEPPPIRRKSEAPSREEEEKTGEENEEIETTSLEELAEAEERGEGGQEENEA